MNEPVRLYWESPLLFEFEARVLSAFARGAQAAVTLDRSAFYPESGGQLADHGELGWPEGKARVVDVQEEDGRVIHVLDLSPESAPPVGAPVRGRIDEWRRRDRMSQHTGQHLLSRALLDLANAPTVSSRLGETVCTIDTPVARLSDEDLARCEDLVARVVLEDRPVRALWPAPEELARLPLRRPPKVSEHVRVIEIEGFDYSPCGGTHCLRTGQVGLVHVMGVERYKGGLRVSFLTGRHAVADYRAKDRVLGELGRHFSTGADGLAAAIRNVEAEAQAQSRAAASLRVRLAQALAPGLLAAAPRVGSAALAWVATVEDDAPVEYLRALATAIARVPNAVALVASRGPEGTRMVVQRGETAAFDAGAALKRMAAAAGGRGGGRPHYAEGVLPRGADAKALFEQERARIE